MNQFEFVLKYPHKGELPEPGRYVLVHVVNRNWGSPDPEGVMWCVARLEKGLTKAERDALPDDDKRKTTFYGADEWNNNKRGYAWEGHVSLNGQDVDYWTELPRGIQVERDDPVMEHAEPVDALSPDWHWVVMERRESAEFYREHGYVVTLKQGARVRSSVPLTGTDNLTSTPDPFAANRWRKG